MQRNGLGKVPSLQADLENLGYGYLAQALAPDAVDALRLELACLEAGQKTRSNGRVLADPSRFMVHQVQFEDCPTVHRLIVEGAGAQMVEDITGDALTCTGVTYAHCKPGYVGIPLHTDFNPYCGNVYRPSNPVALRVLYYLDELTEARAPLRLVPRSHLRLNKRWRYDTTIPEREPGEVRVTCMAGDAVIINTKVFHGVGPNLTAQSRRVIAITYRPRWAAPVQPVPEHDEASLAQLAVDLQPYFRDLNGGFGSP